MICLIYAPRNVQAVREILLHHLKNKWHGVVKMSGWSNTENVQILFGFAPNGNKQAASRQFNVGPRVSGSYLFKDFVNSKRCLYPRISCYALNAGKFCDLSCTLRKPFLSISRLRSGSGKIEDAVHPLT